MANQPATGAAQGAAAGTAAGSVVPGWGTLIGGVVGAIGGYIGGLSSKKAQDEAEELERKIQHVLSVKRFNKLYGKFLPMIRGQIAATYGGRLDQQTGANIAARNLSGTGLGEVLRSLSVVAPGIEAQKQTAEYARNQQITRARQLGDRIQRIQPSGNPLLQALEGAAGGAYSGYKMDEATRGGTSFGRKPAPTENDLYPTYPGGYR